MTARKVKKTGGPRPTPPRRTAEQISGIMRRVKSKDTTPERAFRKCLRAQGVRFRANVAKLPGKPDFVIPSRRVAIFVDGDYWHGNQWRRRGLASLEEQFQASEQRDYWLRKIRANMERDCRATAELTRLGWKVVRFWESDVRDDLDTCVQTALETRPSRGARDPGLAAGKTVAEFFAGIGLMRVGLERQGWRVTFANDIDIQKTQMYTRHFRDDPGHLVLGDIHALSSRRAPAVTLATASFPCNDLSLAGSRDGLKGKQSSAFWGFVKILSGMGRRKPPFVLIENVPGFLTSHGGEDFESACLALNDLGYSTDPFILDAAWFVPQSRQRLFIVGTRAPGGNVNTDLSMHEISPVRPEALVKFIADHRNVRWNLRRLPNPPNRTATLDDMVEMLPDDAPEWWSANRAAYLLSQMNAKHRAIADKMIAGSRRSVGTVFRRVRQGKTMAELRTDGVAGCLRTPRGGSGRQILFVAGSGRYRVRLLTPRECARLMGADDYVISGRQNQALFGFGDAVCVPVIEWIAKYYLNPLVNEIIHARPHHPTRRPRRK